MQFIKYPSLTNHYTARRQKFINFDDDYVATEKIHGSNVSLMVDNGNNIEIAKRTAILTADERAQKPWNTLAQFATEHRYLSRMTTINTGIVSSGIFTSEISLEDLLNKYRDRLTGNYDIV